MVMTLTETNWDRIQRSSWPTVYLGELAWLAKGAYDLCEKVFDSAPVPLVAGESYIKVDHKLHQDIYQVLNSAARIASMVKHRERNKRNQSAGQYIVQKQRIEWLGQVLAGIELTEILNSNVRHSLEHFDEFIDETALKSSRGALKEPTLFAIDFALGRARTIEELLPPSLSHGSVYALRVYVAEDKTFLNCGRRIDLGKVADECLQIAERIGLVAPYLTSEGDRGSNMIIAKRSSYLES